MKETKTSATAVVTLTLNVYLDQPWTGESTLEQVQKRARAEAMDRITGALTELVKRDIRVGQVQSVRIILNEEAVK
jgi:hypothetical protein